MESDQIEKAIEVLDNDMKVFAIISSPNTTPDKTYTYLRSTIPRICWTLLTYCKFGYTLLLSINITSIGIYYVKMDNKEKAVVVAKQTIEYLRVLLDSNVLPLVKSFFDLSYDSIIIIIY